MYRNYILPFRNQATGRQKCETFFFRNNFYKELSVLARANAARPPLCLPFPRAASAVSTGGARALLISSKCEVSKTVPSALSVSLSLFSVLPPFPYLSFSFTAASRDREKIHRKNRGGYSNFDGSAGVYLTVSYSALLSLAFLILFYASSSGSIYVSAGENPNATRPQSLWRYFSAWKSSEKAPFAGLENVARFNYVNYKGD